MKTTSIGHANRCQRMCRRLFVGVFAGAALLPFTGGVAAAPGTGAAAKPVAPAISPIEGAKQALRQLARAKNGIEAAPYLTNESAGVLATFAMVQLGLMVAFSPANTLTAELDDLGQRILPDPGNEKEQAAHIKQHGRQMLTEVGQLEKKIIARLKAQARASGGTFQASGGGMELDKMLDPARARLTYTQISPERVRITGTRNPEPVEARLEDGRWRIHLMDFEPPEKPTNPKP